MPVLRRQRLNTRSPARFSQPAIDRCKRNTFSAGQLQIRSVVNAELELTSDTERASSARERHVVIDIDRKVNHGTQGPFDLLGTDAVASLCGEQRIVNLQRPYGRHDGAFGFESRRNRVDAGGLLVRHDPRQNDGAVQNKGHQ